MTDPLRRAGRGTDRDGATVVWSVAEGRRGRRWREARADGDRLLSSLLLETDPDGRFSHLELSTQAGLLTLHPETDGTLHGNSVTAGGVGHIRGLPWDEGGLVRLEGSSVAVAATPVAGGGEGRAWVLRIGLDLACGVGEEAVESRSADAGVLPDLENAADWPLEREVGDELRG